MDRTRHRRKYSNNKDNEELVLIAWGLRFAALEVFKMRQDSRWRINFNQKIPAWGAKGWITWPSESLLTLSTLQNSWPQSLQLFYFYTFFLNCVAVYILTALHHSDTSFKTCNTTRLYYTSLFYTGKEPLCGPVCAGFIWTWDNFSRNHESPCQSPDLENL